MGIINRIAFLVLTLVSFLVLIVLSLVSPKTYGVYQVYLAELVTKYLWQEENDLSDEL